MNDKIVDFISHFRGSEQTFLNGCCYWFAWILYERFKNEWIVEIYYDPVPGHFVCAFIPRGGFETWEEVRFFDVRGDVTDMYMDKWLNEKLVDMAGLCITDSSHYGRLMRDCKDFIRPE